ncbi:MAG: xylulokinase [Ruminiclostridium sp.]
MSFLIGIDLGTTGVKTVLFDESGKPVASSTVEYPLYQPNLGWAEQNPEDWWKGTCESINNVMLKSGVDKREVRGVGLSGQMHGLVLLDKEDKVLRNAIIWCDQRSAAECDQITQLIGKERLIEITANPALTGFTASKIMWVKNNEPQVFAKIAKILLPKDYIRLKLTGEYATEVSDASGMQLMNIAKRQWSGEVLGKLEISESMLGKMYESQDVTGKVTASAAAITGLNAGTIVVGGAGDQAAGAVGNGIVKSGIVSSTIGTSGVVFAYTDKLTIDPLGRVHTFCHAVPNTYHIMGVTQGAGLSLKWFRDTFCMEELITSELSNIDVYKLLDAEAENVKPCSDGLIYLPYLMGERTPHLDPNAKGVFFGLTAKHTKPHFVRSIMEGVTFSLKDCLEIIKGMGVEVSEVRASGGGGKSGIWRQMQADVFGTSINRISSDEGPALGVAILAGVGAGVYDSVPQACQEVIKVKDSLPPIEDRIKKYDDFYKLYTKLYKSLKGDFTQLNTILK